MPEEEGRYEGNGEDHLQSNGSSPPHREDNNSDSRSQVNTMYLYMYFLSIMWLLSSVYICWLIDTICLDRVLKWL